MKNRVLFLGTGGASGVPSITCTCSVCRSNNPYNKRLRSSILVNYEGRVLLIDAGPDFRQQALNNNISDIDGVLITHTHNDHVAGLDDLRPFCFLHKGPLPMLLSQSSYEDLKERYSYFFTKRNDNENFKVQFEHSVLQEKRGEVEFQGVNIKYMSYRQGNMDILGYRFENFAYITDIKDYPETIFEDLEGVETLIVSATGQNLCHVHFTIDEAIEFSKKIGSKITYLNHLSHQIDYESVSKKLPSNVHLGYDGLSFNV